MATMPKLWNTTAHITIYCMAKPQDRIGGMELFVDDIHWLEIHPRLSSRYDCAVLAGRAAPAMTMVRPLGEAGRNRLATISVLGKARHNRTLEKYAES